LQAAHPPTAQLFSLNLSFLLAPMALG